MTTPVSYLTTCEFEDPFFVIPKGREPIRPNTLRYRCTRSTYGKAWAALTGKDYEGKSLEENLKEFGEWLLRSVGPYGRSGPCGWQGVSQLPPTNLFVPYDPTNGTVSAGDIMRSQLSPTGYLNARGQEEDEG